MARNPRPQTPQSIKAQPAAGLGSEPQTFPPWISLGLFIVPPTDHFWLTFCLLDPWSSLFMKPRFRSLTGDTVKSSNRSKDALESRKRKTINATIKPRLKRTKLNISLILKICLTMHTFSIMYCFSGQKWIVMGWIVSSYPTKIHRVKCKLPVYQNVTVFGDRIIKVVIKLEWGH